MFAAYNSIAGEISLMSPPKATPTTTSASNHLTTVTMGSQLELRRLGDEFRHIIMLRDWHVHVSRGRNESNGDNVVLDPEGGKGRRSFCLGS